MLRTLEERFGPRDPSYTILGVEFCGEVPQIWFPGNCRHVVIQLTPSAMNDVVRAVYQLAHEAVHLLDPGVLGNASVFEEGVANSFSVEYARTVQPSYAPAHPKYDAASQLASRALALRPDVVKHFRSQGVGFSKITAASLNEACPQLADEVAAVLCSSYQAWDGNADALV